MILCDGWKYFCLENPPQFLAGYPNDGAAIVDAVTLTASNYDDIPEAKEYYQKLCEEYNKGVIPSRTFMNTYNQYMEEISSGCVLGMIDQKWDFSDAETIMKENGMSDCTYVPFGLVIDENVQAAYRTPETITTSEGVGITVGCDDVTGALQFMEDLLSDEVMILRFWGEEGIDYEVDENGLFYRTEEQRANANNSEWRSRNFCTYSYFPHYEGLLADGINASDVEQQPSEFQSLLSDQDKRILAAYGHSNWKEFLDCTDENAPWFPIYTERDSWESNSAEGIARANLDTIKKEWLPKVIMSKEDDFAQRWEEYMNIYHAGDNVKVYEDALTAEVRKRAQD